jgi:alpha-ketoglutarate-dependent taurine dioxygenase
MSLSITPLGSALGAAVKGIDLREPQDAATLERLNQALLDHIVLVIRGQRFTPAEYLAAARLFGEPMRQHYSQYQLPGFELINVLSSREAERRPDGSAYLQGTECWHTDHTNRLEPPKLTVLYALALPPVGGDTSFANMRLAYDMLDEDQKQAYGALRTVNALENRAGVTTVPARDSDVALFAEEIEHPLVRRHPENGSKALYFHPTKTVRLVGMQPVESHDFIERLLGRVIRPEIVYRHRWRVGDMLLCDNRSALHRAHGDYDPDAGRLLHRIILKGDRPF